MISVAKRRVDDRHKQVQARRSRVGIYESETNRAAAATDILETHGCNCNHVEITRLLAV